MAAIVCDQWYRQGCKGKGSSWVVLRHSLLRLIGIQLFIGAHIRTGSPFMRKKKLFGLLSGYNIIIIIFIKSFMLYVRIN